VAKNPPVSNHKEDNMKGLVRIVVLTGFFIGLCANTHCGPRDLDKDSPKTCRDQDSDGYCNKDDFWPGYDDDGQLGITTDDLDGYLIRQRGADGFFTNSLVTDDAMLSDQADIYDMDYDLAVLALPMEPYQQIVWDMVEDVSLKVFLLNYTTFSIPGWEACPTQSISVSIKASSDLPALLASACNCTTAGNPTTCTPEYCSLGNSFDVVEPRISMDDLGDGWFELSGSVLLDAIRDASETQDYLVISLNSYCSSGYYVGWKPIELEDSGNHGGSNNLPTIEFYFTR
jgi:hypothetical protein